MGLINEILPYSYTVWINIPTIYTPAAQRWQVRFSHSAVINNSSKSFHIDPKGSRFHCYDIHDSVAFL